MKATNQNTVTPRQDSSLPSQNHVFLHQYLSIFEEYLSDPKVSEICVNKPGEVWIERMGLAHMQRFTDEKITTDILWRLGRLVANQTHQEIAKEAPLLSASLPNIKKPPRALSCFVSLSPSEICRTIFSVKVAPPPEIL